MYSNKADRTNRTPWKKGFTFEEAKCFRMPFGHYKGKSFDEIAQTDEGLRYLDYMLGELADQPGKGPVLPALLAYLGDETIQKEVQRVVGNG